MCVDAKFFFSFGKCVLLMLVPRILLWTDKCLASLLMRKERSENGQIDNRVACLVVDGSLFSVFAELILLFSFLSLLITICCCCFVLLLIIILVVATENETRDHLGLDNIARVCEEGVCLSQQRRQSHIERSRFQSRSKSK